MTVRELSRAEKMPKTSAVDGPRVTLLIIALNEADNLPHVISRIPRVVDEIWLVDGHSTDDSVAIAKTFRPDIRVAYQQGRGKGDAIRCGIRHATGDIIVTIDADGSMAPEEIPRFVEPLLDGHDFVKGSRFLQHGGSRDMPVHRVFGNKLFVFLVNLLFGSGYTDLCYGYNAFRSEAIRNIGISSDGFEIETELHIKALRAGLRVTEVASYESARMNGKGNLRSLSDGLRIFKTILRERFSGNGCRAVVEYDNV